MKWNKSFACLLLSLCLIFGGFTLPVAAVVSDTSDSPAVTGVFEDVPSDHWANKEISWMARNNILAGKGNNLYDPGAAVTREQFARIMVRSLQLTVLKNPTPSFSDVPVNTWSFADIESAKPYLTGWNVPGSALDLFKPKEDAVREDMAVALVKALGLQNEFVDLKLLDAFEDANTISPNPSIRQYVALAVEHGIMQGTVGPDGTRYFKAQETLTRAQAAVLLYNTLILAGDKVTYDDVEKVAYGTDPEKVEVGTRTALVSALVKPDRVRVTWNQVDSRNFKYYKIVLSPKNSKPSYPDDGYVAALSDPATTSIDLKMGKTYHGGHVGGTLKAGVPYWLSITAVYQDGKTVGNVVQITLPVIP